MSQQADQQSKYILGIDLGSRKSTVGVWKEGQVKIITNEQGNSTTPSYVAFTESERLIGDAAKNQMWTNPQNTVFDAKLLIGRNFDDLTLKSDIKNMNLPFTVKRGTDGKPQIGVNFNGEPKIYSPEDISGMILTKMKETAEAYLECEVKDAVITVPAYFNDSQCQATMGAGKIAGLNVLRFINEPTAAAIAYGLDRNKAEEQNVLVFDMSDVTFDVSVLTIDKGVIEVKATNGNKNLGGVDFNNSLVEWCVAAFKKEHVQDIQQNATAMRRLQTACERAIHELNSGNEAKISFNNLLEGLNFETTITRANFEELNVKNFSSIRGPLKKVLHDAKMSNDQVHEIVMVGTASLIPKIRELVSAFFNGREPLTSINPDVVVATGAAIRAHILNGGRIDDATRINTVPLSLGLETAGGIMTTLIKRGKVIPCKRSHTFSTYTNGQSGVLIKVFEGERQFTRDCNQLGNFKLEGIPPMPRGAPQIEVSFDIDANGILNVSATEKSSGISQKIIITNDKGRLSKDEIDRMVQEAENNAAGDKKGMERVEAKNRFEAYLDYIRNSVREGKEKGTLDESTVAEVEGWVKEGIEWLEANGEASKEEYDKKQKAYEEKIKPVMMKLY